jgi:TPR repeat protein
MGIMSVCRVVAILVVAFTVALGGAHSGRAASQGDATVRSIQTNLQMLGYEITVVDGLYGPETRKAIEAFQADNDLPVTGEATDGLRRRLEHRVFRRSDAAKRLWRQSRLYLKALGYAPGSGSMDSVPARRALAAFARNYWLENPGRFSRTVHDLIRRRVAKNPNAHEWLCKKHMAEGAYSLALGWCRRAAERETRPAQYHMGWMAYYGRGRPRSSADAFMWFRRAAQAGHTKAQVYTGLMYREGRGTERDMDAAMRWYLEATGGAQRPDPPPPPLPD